MQLGLESFSLKTILLQNELPIYITTTVTVETHITGHHVYKEIWTPKQNEYLNVRSEPENPLNNYAVCVLKGADIVRNLKKGYTGRFSKTIFYLLLLLLLLLWHKNFELSRGNSCSGYKTLFELANVRVIGGIFIRK